VFADARGIAEGARVSGNAATLKKSHVALHDTVASE
jgi:hypothetical protein